MNGSYIVIVSAEEADVIEMVESLKSGTATLSSGAVIAPLLQAAKEIEAIKKIIGYDESSDGTIIDAVLKKLG